MQLWDILNKRPKIPTKKYFNGNDISKFKLEYNQNDLEFASKNYRAMNQLCSTLN